MLNTLLIIIISIIKLIILIYILIYISHIYIRPEINIQSRHGNIKHNS